MKRSFTLILLCLFFCFTTVTTLAQPTSNLIKEGIYSISSLNLELDKIYAIQNTSDTKIAFVFLMDDHDELLQFIKLLPKSAKQRLLPMKPQYKLIITGDTEVFVSKPEP
jgi:hypothetical protein